MKKKLILILFSFFLPTVLLSNSFAQSDAEVMRRYDFSSPQKSFESYKQAIISKDWSGIVIHLWQISRGNKDSRYYGANLEDLVKSYQEPEELKDEALKMFNRILRNNKRYNVSDLEFVKEEKRITDGDLVSCIVILKDKESGDTVSAHLDSLDAAKTWWFEIVFD